MFTGTELVPALFALNVFNSAHFTLQWKTDSTNNNFFKFIAKYVTTTNC